MNNKEIYNFMEQNFNIKLLPYQKLMLDNCDKINNFSFGDIFINYRRGERKMRFYMQLLNVALFMKDDEKINIISPKEIKEFNREELFNYLQNDYWKER